MNILDYFDLNKRTLGARLGASREPSFGIKSMPTSPEPSAPALSARDQVVMYAGTVIGVLFSSAVTQAKVGTFGGFNFQFPGFILAGIIALAIMPIIYEKLSVKSNTPFIVRLGLFVQQGVFWQVLIGAIGKTIAS